MSPKDQTTLLLVNPERVNVSVPRTLRHNEITSGLTWRLEDILTPEDLNPTELDTIIEFSSGAVDVSFAPLRRSNSLRTPKFSQARTSLDRHNHTTPPPEYEFETYFTEAKS